MAEFKKREQNSFWHSPLSLGVLFVIVVIFAYNMIGLIKKERETSKNKTLILDQINSLKTREQDLSSGIAKLKTAEGTEDTIREKYQVVKQGEKMLVIIDDKSTTPSNTTDLSKSHGFWNFIKNLFKF